jgi:hypothetical protein
MNEWIYNRRRILQTIVGVSAYSLVPRPAVSQSTTESNDADVTETVIDDFETGELSEEWQNPDGEQSFDQVNGAHGRESFTVQSEIAPQGEYALMGEADATSEVDDSQLILQDLSITTDGTSLRFYLKLGSLLTDYEQANIFAITNQNGEAILRFDQKNREAARDEGTFPDAYIWSETLSEVSLVEINNINFSSNEIGEIRIDGETYATDVAFITESSGIQVLGLHQGHYRNSENMVVDGISYFTPTETNGTETSGSSGSGTTGGGTSGSTDDTQTSGSNEGESESNGVAATLFQESPGGGGSLLPLLGISGVGGLGFLAYRRMQTDDETSAETTTAPAELGTDSEHSSTDSPSPESYSDTYADYTEGTTLRSMGHIQVTHATSETHADPVALYAIGRDEMETLDTEVFNSITEGFESWSTIDDHENILSVYNHGKTPAPWAAIELVETQFDPAAFTDESLARKRELIEDLCEAVHEGHRYGLTHGSLDTGTFVIEADGEPSLKIGDWGITEPAISDTADQQSDIDQVVNLAFELFTGEPPSIDEPESASYPDGLKAVFKPLWQDEEAFETVIHFRDAIDEAI